MHSNEFDKCQISVSAFLTALINSSTTSALHLKLIDTGITIVTIEIRCLMLHNNNNNWQQQILYTHTFKIRISEFTISIAKLYNNTYGQNSDNTNNSSIQSTLWHDTSHAIMLINASS